MCSLKFKSIANVGSAGNTEIVLKYVNRIDFNNYSIK